jgi:hypothetical protein
MSFAREMGDGEFRRSEIGDGRSIGTGQMLDELNGEEM